MTCYEIWSLIIQSVVGAATLLIAIIAIWGNLFRSWWSGPKLKVFILNPLGEVNPLNDGTPVRNYHLKVTNSRKGAPAYNVRMILTKIFQPAADGRLVDRSFSGPLQLTWQFSAMHPQFSLIGPDDICNLGSIKKGERFGLMPYIVPNNFTGYVEANQKLQAEVVAVADNGQSEPIHIAIAWDGIWSDDTMEMSRHLVVKEVV
jgi:hypothetical protein